MIWASVLIFLLLLGMTVRLVVSQNIPKPTTTRRYCCRKTYLSPLQLQSPAGTAQMKMSPTLNSSTRSSVPLPHVVPATQWSSPSLISCSPWLKTSICPVSLPPPPAPSTGSTWRQIFPWKHKPFLSFHRTQSTAAHCTDTTVHIFILIVALLTHQRAMDSISTVIPFSLQIT